MAPLKNTRRMAAGGGVLALAVIVAGIINNLFTGGGGGGSPGEPQVSVHSPTSPPAEAVPEREPPEEREPIDEGPQVGQVLEVRIEEQRYFHISDGNGGGSSPQQSLELERIINLARSADGNDDGVRVRIIRSPSSRPTAEEALLQELAEAGIARDAIEIRDGFTFE